MTGHYSIDVDPVRDLVHIRLSGFFDLATIAAFDRARRPAYARLTCGPNQQLTLCDISGCNLQSQEAVAAFRGVLAERSLFSRRLALLTGSSLARMQARRILDRDTVACFVEEADAMAWLFAPDPVVA